MAEEPQLPDVMSIPKGMMMDTEVLHQRTLGLRTAFHERFADKIKSGAYDQRDLDRFESSEEYAGCFLLTAKVKGDVQKAVVDVNEVFDFRKEMGIWDWSDEMFPRELWERKLCYYHGEDRKGHPLLQIRTKEHKAKTPEESQLVKKFIVWNFEKHHREKAGLQRCVVMFDMSGAGLGDLNIDLSKYIIRLFTLFPSFTMYVLNFELPWLLSAAWKTISMFLHKEQAKRLVLVGKKDIKLYIPDEHLLDHQK